MPIPVPAGEDTPYTYTPETSLGVVRLLLNDVAAPWVFTDAELTAFLSLEAGSVKRAAAQAIDVNATNEALASKVLRTPTLTTDGAKLADAMRKHADTLRAQADAADQLADLDDSGFALVNFNLHPTTGAELVERPLRWL